MRGVECKVTAEGLAAVGIQECDCLLANALSEVASVFKNLSAIAPEIMEIRPAGFAPVEAVRVEVDAAAEVAVEVVEAMRVGDGVRFLAKVPFADGGGAVTRLLERGAKARNARRQFSSIGGDSRIGRKAT